MTLITTLMRSFHTRRIIYKTVHQTLLIKWHGPATQHAKFKTTKHRERESKSGKIVLSTQETNASQMSQIEEKSESRNVVINGNGMVNDNGMVNGNGVDDVDEMENVNERVEGKPRARSQKSVKRLVDNNGIRVEQETKTRSGRLSKRPDFLMPRF